MLIHTWLTQSEDRDVIDARAVGRDLDLRRQVVDSDRCPSDGVVVSQCDVQNDLERRRRVEGEQLEKKQSVKTNWSFRRFTHRLN